MTIGRCRCIERPANNAEIPGSKIVELCLATQCLRLSLSVVAVTLQYRSVILVIMVRPWPLQSFTQVSHSSPIKKFANIF